MPLTMQEFAQLLGRCAQSSSEATEFIESFAKVRLEGIIRALLLPVEIAAAEEAQVDPDWSDPRKLEESGLPTTIRPDQADLGSSFLHVDVASAPGRGALKAYLDMTGLSDKQRGDLFPILSGVGSNAPRQSVASEVRRLNGLLQWVRDRGVDPTVFLAYQRHLSIHGASQNFSGAVGAMGAAIAFMDALEELSSGCIEDQVGLLPPGDVRSPEDVAAYLTTGTKKEVAAKRVTAFKLNTGRFIVFASDPDCSIFRTSNPGIVSAADALKLYNGVRKSVEGRRDVLQEFAVGEVKTATDPSNLHERLALGGRENRNEVAADRFLMMALLTKDILEGGSGRKSARAPLQNRDTVRFSHVFNLHHAWGWDGGRERHPEHWLSFKQALAGWCGLPKPTG